MTFFCFFSTGFFSFFPRLYSRKSTVNMDHRQAFIKTVLPCIPHPLIFTKFNKIQFNYNLESMEITIGKTISRTCNQRLMGLIISVSLLYDYPQFVPVQDYWKVLPFRQISWTLDPFAVLVK